MKTIEVQEPIPPSAETLTDPSLTFPSKCGTALLTYCPRAAAGGQYNPATKSWLIVTGVSARVFIAMLREMGLAELPEGIDRCAWVMGRASESQH